jgi:hypothetical protein
MSEHRQPLRFITALRESAGSIRHCAAGVPADLAVWTDVRAFPPLAVIAALDCLAGLLLWRKSAGGSPLALTNVRLSLAALAIAALIVGGRWWLARIEGKSPALWLRTLLMVLAALPMLVLLSLANAHHSPWAVSLTGALTVVSGGAVLLWNRLSSARSASSESPSPLPVLVRFPATVVAVPCPTDADRAVPTSVPGNAAGTTYLVDDANGATAGGEPDEWMERTTDGSGSAILRGRVVAEFTSGQSVATVHIAFCPAFVQIPEFTCEVEGAPSARARAPAVYRYGARIELKRAGDTSAPARLRLCFRASIPAGSSRAA